MAARRTVGAAIPAALATASAITPASAPWRSSPPSSRRRNVCSASVAAANRSATNAARRACEPLPAVAPISVNAASTSATVSVGTAAGGGSERSAAQPTPIWRCGSSPDSQDTMTAMPRVSLSRAASLSRWAIRVTFARRDDSAPTSAEVVTTSVSNTRSA